MNCDRLIFLVTVFVLSNLLDNALSAQAKAFRVNLLDEQTTADVDSNKNIGRSAFGGFCETISMSFDGAPVQIAKNSISITQADPWSNSDRSSEPDNLKNFTVEKPLATNKPLGLGGIAVVSLISLILLKFLFTPPAKICQTPVSSAAKSKVKTIAEGDRQSVVEKKPIVENFEISQLTILNSDTLKIDVVVELIKYLQQPDEDFRREAIWELAKIGDSRAIEPLTEILSQVNSTDRSSIIKAITQITKRSFQPINQ